MAIEIYVTCPNEATALAIGRAAVAARLAACANVSGPVRSVFAWEGAIEDEAEWTLCLKTRDALFDAAAELIRDRHPYSLPAILGHPVRVDPATAGWIDAETDPR